MLTTAHEPLDTMEDLHASDVMTTDVVTVDPATPVGAALTVMRRMGVRHLPVTDDAGCFLGLVDDRLVTTALLSGGARELALEQPVDDAMTRYVPQVAPDEGVARVSRLLRSSRCDAVVVVDEQDHLLGLITLVDVVGAVGQVLAPRR